VISRSTVRVRAPAPVQTSAVHPSMDRIATPVRLPGMHRINYQDSRFRSILFTPLPLYAAISIFTHPTGLFSLHGKTLTILTASFICSSFTIHGAPWNESFQPGSGTMTRKGKTPMASLFRNDHIDNTNSEVYYIFMLFHRGISPADVWIGAPCWKHCPHYFRFIPVHDHILSVLM
jgi:hypothetical protein